MPPELSDVDGNTEVRQGTVSAFNSPAPTIRVFDTQAGETAGVAEWLSEMQSQGVAAHESGIFVRTAHQLDRASAAVRTAGLKSARIGQNMEVAEGHIGIGIMHTAKGLEIRAVAVIAWDADVIPLESRLV